MTNIRNVNWRDGRPRFSPGPALRAEAYAGTDLRWPDPAPDGWKPTDLKTGDRNGGRWFTRGEAIDWSDNFVSGRKARATAANRSKARPVRVGVSVAGMFEAWRQSPKFKKPRPEGYSVHTIEDYAQKARVLEEDHPLIWNMPAAAVTRPLLRAAFERTQMKRGLATARGMILTLSGCYAWATLVGAVKRTDNPALKLKMSKPAPRVRFGSRAEIDGLVAMADAIGRPELGDGVLLAVWTGQRQGDRCAYLHKGVLHGRRHFRQSKTGAIVAVLESPQLEARLSASLRRRAAARAEALLAIGGSDAGRRAVELRFAHVLLDETRWLPFSGDHWSRSFAQLRQMLTAGLGHNETPADALARHAKGDKGQKPDAWKVAPVASVETLWDLDMRDTAVTWMALAGSTIPEIIAVTGHDAETAHTILKHYLARHPEMADAAIRKMIEWYDNDGETEIGL